MPDCSLTAIVFGHNVLLALSAYGMAMSLPCYDLWLSFTKTYSRVGGRVIWPAAYAPRFVEFAGSWPVIRISLTGEERRNHLRSRIQIRKSSWHAHLPRRRLGAPAAFCLTAQESRRCVSSEVNRYVCDFTGLTPLPSDDLERRAIVLLEQIEDIRRFHPEVLDRLGIAFRVVFLDSIE